MLKKILTAAAALSLLAAVSCTTGPDVRVRALKGEGDFKVPVKKTIAVDLKAQLGTGYSWKITELPAALKLQDEKIITEEQDKTGGIDLQRFIFRGVKKGSGTVIFRYGEHWKKKPSYIKSYKALITVE